MSPIRVMVVGAAGRMGREVVRAVCTQEDMELVAAVDRNQVGQDAARLAGLDRTTVPIRASLEEALRAAAAEVAVDFTLPEAVKRNVETLLRARVACVVGTTGLTEEDLGELSQLCRETQTPCLVAPNFSLGAVLMMQFAAQAARHFSAVEIVELHHAGKVDAPSGTALRTARLIAGQRQDSGTPPQTSPARGEIWMGVPIHSVRLPGLVAHQEVIFGGTGETLTLRHDSTSRECFMPGVLLAIRRVRELSGLVVGLEAIL